MNRFIKIWAPMKSSKVCIKTETKIIKDMIKLNTKHRKDMELKERWRNELYDTFQLISMSLTHPSQRVANQNHRYIGKLGFMKLLNNGKLLNLRPERIEEYFLSVDLTSKCYVNFDSVWVWFYEFASKKNRYMQKTSNKSFDFTILDILSIQEWVMIILLNRYGMDMLSANDSSLYLQAMQSNRNKKGKAVSIKILIFMFGLNLFVGFR